MHCLLGRRQPARGLLTCSLADAASRIDNARESAGDLTPGSEGPGRCEPDGARSSPDRAQHFRAMQYACRRLSAPPRDRDTEDFVALQATATNAPWVEPLAVV
jgi:hypothetical protein